MACDLNLNADQRQILDAAAALLAADAPDPLAEIAGFGAFALSLDEEFGGAGFTLVEDALLHVLFGRHLVSTHALATTLAVRIAARAGLDELATEFASGAQMAAVAVAAGGALRLVEPAGARHAVVFDGNRLRLVAVAGLAGSTETGLGGTVALSTVEAGAADTVAETADADIRAFADLLVSAELLGIAEATRDLAVAYAGTHRQFGKPIGAFQAVKHHAANMAIAAETLSATLDMAAISLRDGRADAGFQLAALCLIAPDAALANARTAIQLHGGIGFSAEASVHRFLKQAHLLRLLLSPRDMLAEPAPMAPRAPSREVTP
ncbi:acyl-CoA dehydrogenase [Martelella soudanensis]|uniref:acyl-CoA dehydrogenase n=1 Tax=unclassified Martelella TaxID=2629616 RepID=UPI0015DD6334|nr:MULTISPECIES: acyl-CoA dehydrogenase [unclassified Martelella]